MWLQVRCIVGQLLYNTHCLQKRRNAEKKYIKIVSNIVYLSGVWLYVRVTRWSVAVCEGDKVVCGCM